MDLKLTIQGSGIQDLINKLSSPLTSQEKAKIQDIVKGNFSDVWATDGASIGADWNGRDLVESGALKASLTSGTPATFNATGFNITSNRNYASFVNNRYRFMTLSSTSLKQIASVYSRQSLISR
jgi:hypothetical protein